MKMKFKPNKSSETKCIPYWMVGDARKNLELPGAKKSSKYRLLSSRRLLNFYSDKASAYTRTQLHLYFWKSLAQNNYDNPKE